MKSFICSLILLFSIIVSAITVGSVVGKKLDDFAEFIDDTIDSSVGKEEIDKIKEKYTDLKPLMILFINESEIREIEQIISELESVIDTGEQAEINMSKNRLILHIRQLKRLSTFSFEAIF